MKKSILTIILLSVFIIISCEEPQETDEVVSTITINSPINGYEFIYNGEPLEINASVSNPSNMYAAYIYVDGNIIYSGLEENITTYFEPNSEISRNVSIEAVLLDSDNQIISSDLKSITINTLNSQTSDSDIVFMNVNDEFKIMRTPVTNRQFLYFLNNNKQLNIELVDIVWNNIDNDTNGDPYDCEFDADDAYEPTNWWYVSVTANYANENIPSGEYVVYRNADNIYDTNADYSTQAGRIRYNCETELFYLPNESDGSESLYIDHPVVGVSWIGANIFANYYGWSLPSLEQWEKAAKGENSWEYPWQSDSISTNFANYNNSETSIVKKYNGINELNLSLSSYGLYDMGGNVWEYTSSNSSIDSYYKTGGAFDSSEENLLMIMLTILRQIN